MIALRYSRWSQSWRWVGAHLFAYQALVLDEADRILDMGFKTQLDKILSYLPQTGGHRHFSLTTLSNKDIHTSNSPTGRRAADTAILSNPDKVSEGFGKVEFEQP
jgi:hypothetical protein